MCDTHLIWELTFFYVVCLLCFMDIWYHVILIKELATPQNLHVKVDDDSFNNGKFFLLWFFTSILVVEIHKKLIILDFGVFNNNFHVIWESF